MKKENAPPSTSKSKKQKTRAPSREEIISILNEMASILEILDANPFKVRAYANAAQALESVPDDLQSMIASGALLEVRGIGKSIFTIIKELLETGHSTDLEELKTQIPEGVLEMLQIPGLGPKKVKAIYEKLSVKTIDELEIAAQEGRIAELSGFGQKSADKILKGIESVRIYSGRHHLDKAMNEAQSLYKSIAGHKDVQRSMIGGSLRRFRETIKDIDILISAEKADSIMDVFTTLPRVESVVAKGPTKSSVVLKSGLNADLRVVTDEEYAFASHYFTGSKQHNTELRSRAKKMGYKLNEYGLFKDDKSVTCRTEEDLFNTLGLEYIPPEIREAFDEIERAEKHELPELITEKDLKGLFHVHTSYSDGSASIAEMAKATQKIGFEYLGITDHSQSTVYAGGMPPDRVKKQAEEVAAVNETLKGFRVLHGIEADILSDGDLDYDDEILSTFDFVIASVHSNFGFSETQMTKRIIRAIENPHTTMLGHPTGRVLLAREGYKIDLNAVIEAASRCKVAIEINSHPHRLDLDWRFVRTARDKGVKIAIGPDAHTRKGLEDFRYGVGIARKGWLCADDVLNCLSTEDIVAYFKETRGA